MKTGENGDFPIRISGWVKTEKLFFNYTKSLFFQSPVPSPGMHLLPIFQTSLSPNCLFFQAAGKAVYWLIMRRDSSSVNLQE